MPSQGAKRWLRLAGNVLSAVAVLFVLQRLATYHAQLDPALVGRLVLPVGILGLVYGGSSVFLAFAWRNTLGHLDTDVDRRTALHVYGVSQLAKYVPGNVFHLVGRQAKGLECGLPGWPLAKSMAWELGLLAAAGGLFAVWLMPRVVPGTGPLQAVGLFLSLFAVAAILLGRFGSRPLARALAWDVGFLLLMGLGFVVLLAIVADSTGGFGPATISLVAAAYVIGWLAGFLTPGAPAGLGVREVVVLGVLQADFGEPVVLAAVLAARVVSVIGDVVVFVLARALAPAPGKD